MNAPSRRPPAPHPRGFRRSERGAVGRILLFVAAGLFALYLAGATAGYLFVRYVRKNENIGFVDVALLRWREVRRGMAAQQFAKAKVEWDAANYQIAFLSYNFGVNNDPDNIPGRLMAAQFLQAAGSNSMALTTLEDGLARAPDDPRLIERTFTLLNTTGREQRALELLARRPASAWSGPNGPALRTYELEATTNLGDVAAARKLLDQHPELLKLPRATPTVARVYWEAKERLRAINLLTAYVGSRPDGLDAYTQLVQWQLSAEMGEEAVATAGLAMEKFPGDIAARVLQLEALGVRENLGPAWVAAVGAYFKDFGARPEAITQLAALAGRRGWVDLARALYELGALHQQNLSILGFCYGDALLRQGRFREVQAVLTQIESQAVEGSAPFLAQLRNRQVIAAAALGDAAAVRDSARRLASVLRSDPEGMEATRRNFQRSGLVAAAAELTGRPAAARPAVPANK